MNETLLVLLNVDPCEKIYICNHPARHLVKPKRILARMCIRSPPGNIQTSYIYFLWDVTVHLKDLHEKCLSWVTNWHL